MTATALKIERPQATAPWGTLGVKVLESTPPLALLQAAKLDWTVDKSKISFLGKEGGNGYLSQIDIPGKYALVRSSDQKVMDIVSEVYQPVQNIEALNFFDEFCKAGQLKMDTVGSLGQGKFVFAIASMMDGFTLKNGSNTDTIEGHLLFSLPHKLNHSINIGFTSIRPVCMNTLRLAINDMKNRFTMWHSQKWDPEAAKDVLGLGKGQLEHFKEVATLLSRTPYNEVDLMRFWKQVFPITQQAANDDDTAPVGMSRRAAEAAALVETSPGANFAPGTWWNALNAVTYMTDHTMGRTADGRMKQAWFGSTAVLKDKALRLATEYAVNAA